MDVIQYCTMVGHIYLNVYVKYNCANKSCTKCYALWVVCKCVEFACVASLCSYDEEFTVCKKLHCTMRMYILHDVYHVLLSSLSISVNTRREIQPRIWCQESFWPYGTNNHLHEVWFLYSFLISVFCHD